MIAETDEERQVRLNVAVALAEAAMTWSRWALLGVATAFVGVFVAWVGASAVASVGGMLISFAGLGFVVWCARESRRLVRRSRELMRGPVQ